jgi:FkbM family methyltransferase
MREGFSKLLSRTQRVASALNRNAKLSFSLEGEDCVLRELARFHNATRGFYVDVGAHHPTRFSNTAAFYSSGWRGINIDATPGSMQVFRKLRRGDVNIECAVSNAPGKRTFCVYNDPALNGIDCDRSEELRNTRFKLLNKIPIEAKQLCEILSRHIDRLPSPNFLTVDAEGHDLEVLESNDWSRFPFEWVMTELESFDLTRASICPAVIFLASKGYSLRAFTGRTGIFSRS